MAQQKIFTAEILRALAANGQAMRAAQERGGKQPDPVPVVKIFNPYGAATWLLTESDPDEPDILFGLCDLGQGYAELGSVRRSEIEEVRVPIGRHGLPLERDEHFRPKYPLSVYAEAAGGFRITERPDALEAAAKGRAA